MGESEDSLRAKVRAWARQLLLLLAFGLVAIGVVMAVPLLLARFGAGGDLRPGSTPPDFSLRSLEGQTVSLSAQKGNPVVLVFVASWCEVCRAEMPMMVETYQAHRPHDIVFLAVDSYEDRAPVEKFREEFRIPFPLLLDTDGAVASRYNIKGTPTNVFIDRGGRVRDLVLGGPLSRAYLEREIAPLLDTALR